MTLHLAANAATGELNTKKAKRITREHVTLSQIRTAKTLHTTTLLTQV